MIYKEIFVNVLFPELIKSCDTVTIANLRLCCSNWSQWIPKENLCNLWNYKLNIGLAVRCSVCNKKVDRYNTATAQQIEDIVTEDSYLYTCEKQNRLCGSRFVSSSLFFFIFLKISQNNSKSNDRN